MIDKVLMWLLEKYTFIFEKQKRKEKVK